LVGTYTDDRLGPEHLWRQLATGSVNASMFFISPSGLFGMDLEFAEGHRAVDSGDCTRSGTRRGRWCARRSRKTMAWGLLEPPERRGQRPGQSLRQLRDGTHALLDLCDRLGVGRALRHGETDRGGATRPQRTKLLNHVRRQAVTDALARRWSGTCKAEGVVGDVALDGPRRSLPGGARGALLALLARRTPSRSQRSQSAAVFRRGAAEAIVQAAGRVAQAAPERPPRHRLAAAPRAPPARGPGSRCITGIHGTVSSANSRSIPNSPRADEEHAGVHRAASRAAATGAPAPAGRPCTYPHQFPRKAAPQRLPEAQHGVALRVLVGRPTSRPEMTSSSRAPRSPRPHHASGSTAFDCPPPSSD